MGRTGVHEALDNHGPLSGVSDLLNMSGGNFLY